MGTPNFSGSIREALAQVEKKPTHKHPPFTWTTPDGFYVEQRYPEMKSRRVKTVIDGEVVKLSIQEEQPGIDRRKMTQAIAPNWVHSMDACALRRYVVLGKDNGIQHFCMIHDSYGTVAADVEMMAACLRKAFVLMYQENDVLSMFRDEMLAQMPEDLAEELPPVPEKGDLDITLVEESDFFFA